MAQHDQIQRSVSEFTSGPDLGQICFRFGLSLIQQFESSNGSSSSNFTISPYSLHSALTMFIPGAQMETFNELIRALGYVNLPIDQYSLIYRSYLEMFDNEKALQPISVFSSLMHSRPTQDISTGNRKCFNLDYIPDNGRPGDALNKWINTKSRGSIKRWAEVTPSKSSVYLLNSASFRALWAPIDETLDKRAFRNADGTVVASRWMTRSQRYRQNELPEGTVFLLSNTELPVQMALFLPNQDLYYRTRSFAKILEPYRDDFRKLLTGNTMGKVDIAMPKQKLYGYSSVKGLLQSVGVRGIFRETSGSDGLKTPAGQRLCLAEALCAYDIELRETEVKTTNKTPSKSSRGKLLIDRPYMIMMFHNKTKVPIFMNIVNKL